MRQALPETLHASVADAHGSMGAVAGRQPVHGGTSSPDHKRPVHHGKQVAAVPDALRCNRGTLTSRPAFQPREGMLMIASLRLSVLVGFVALALLTPGLPAPVTAAGGGGENRSSGTPAKAEDPQYTAAVQAIKAGDYGRAIPLLESVVSRDNKSADAYNWLAYATRKNGNAAAAIPIYEKALAIDPKHRGAHEYLGETYLTLDNLPKAKEHLRTLDSLCLFSCSEYRDLKRAVEAYENSGGNTKPSAASR